MQRGYKLFAIRTGERYRFCCQSHKYAQIGLRSRVSFRIPNLSENVLRTILSIKLAVACAPRLLMSTDTLDEGGGRMLQSPTGMHGANGVLEKTLEQR